MDQQRSQEWFAARKGRITGSRIGAILGLSPFTTREDVMRAMVREYHGAPSEFEGNIATQFGQTHEVTAIRMFELETGLTVQDTGFHAYEDWAGASPDGLIGEDAIIEVKVPFKGIRKTLSEQPHYMAQIQWEVMCTGRSKFYFWQWQPDGAQTLEQGGVDNAALAIAVDEGKKFYAEYLQELGNPEHLEPLRKEINTNEAKSLLDEYDQLGEAIDNAKERQDEVKARLIEIACDKNALMWGRKVTKVEKEGAISYAKAIKALCPKADLEPYRGKPSVSWRIG